MDSNCSKFRRNHVENFFLGDYSLITRNSNRLQFKNKILYDFYVTFYGNSVGSIYILKYVQMVKNSIEIPWRTSFWNTTVWTISDSNPLWFNNEILHEFYVTFYGNVVCNLFCLTGSTDGMQRYIPNEVQIKRNLHRGIFKVNIVIID